MDRTRKTVLASALAGAAVLVIIITLVIVMQPQVHHGGTAIVATITPSTTTASSATTTPLPTATLPPTPTTTIFNPWKVVPSPSLNVPSGAYLLSIASDSANDIWAVGSYGLIDRWNGTQWKVVTQVCQQNYYDTEAITVLSATNVWAVGICIVHWDGQNWQQYPYPAPAHGTLHSIAVIAPNDIWAVGDDNQYDQYATNARYNFAKHAFAEHWDGTQWNLVNIASQQNIPTGKYQLQELTGIAAIASDNVWAVGAYAISTDAYLPSAPIQTLVEHWDGTQWNIVPSSNISGYNNSLSAITVISANDIWSVGSGADFSNGNVQQALAEHWNGSKWSMIPTVPSSPGKMYSYLSSVTAFSSHDVWAVGGINNFNQTLIEHWDGSSWKAQGGPNPSNLANELFGVVATASGRLWAVGEIDGTNVTNRQLIESSQ